MICFHHIDLDGHCAGAVIKLAHPQCRMYPINYDIKFPFNQIKENEKVWITDFSLQKPGQWKRLRKITKRIVWIDHHISEMNKVKGTAIERLGGVRTTKASAAALTWFYVHRNITPPAIVLYVSDYDTFTFKHGNTKFIEAGCSACNTDPGTIKGLKFWKTLMENSAFAREKLESLTKEGEIIVRYRKRLTLDFISSYGFEADLDGHKCLCCLDPKGINFYDCLREQFDLGDYDFVVTFSFNGENWNVSVYSEKGDNDTSIICRRYGGGGHTKAGGFQAKTLPFENVKRI